MLDRRLLREAHTASGGILLVISLGAGLGLVTVVQALFLARIVKQVFLDRATLQDVRPSLIWLLGVILLRSLLVWASEVSAGSIAIRVKTDLRERLTRHLVALGPAFVQGERTGELVSTTVEGIESLDAYFSQYLPQLILAALVPLIILVWITPFDLLSGVILLVTAPLIPFFMVLIGNTADSLTRRRWQLLSWLSAHFFDVLQGLTTLKLLGAARVQASVIAEMSRRYGEITLGVLRVAFLSALALELLATLSTAIIAVEIGLRLLYGGLAFEQALTILILAPEFYLPLRMLGARFHASVSGVTASRRVFELLDAASLEFNPSARPDPERSSPPPPGSGPDLGKPSSRPSPEKTSMMQTRPGPPFTIAFDRVSLSYAENRLPALQAVSFEIRPGETVALVGPTGAGKSSLVRLLLRFIEPTGGEIRVNGVTLSEIPADAWRAQVAWVPQMPYLLNDTLAANLKLANPAATSAEMADAARHAHLDEVVRDLGQGFETIIGEHGARLSSGQAQRLALARAFLKNAPVLLLDEPTSNLDPELEARLTASTRRLTEGRTVLLIAHRLTSVAHANRIIVLAEGRVVQVGTHTGLLEQEGPYRRLVRAFQEGR